MRKIFETIKDREYFDTHYPTIQKDNKIERGGQLLSFATESLVFSTIIFHTFGELLPAWYIFGFKVNAGRVISVLMGLSFAALLEYAVKNRTIDVVRALLKITKVDALPFRILFLLCLYCISAVTSWQGAKLVAEKIVPITEQASTAGIDSMYYQKLAITKQSFAADSAMLAANYNAKIKAVKQSAAAQVAQQKQYINTFKQREATEQKLYTTRIAAHYANIKKYEAQKAATISDIETEKAAAIFAAHQQKSTTLLSAQGIYDKHQNRVITDQEKSTAKRETAVFIAGNSLAAFTVAMLCYLFFATRQNEKFLRDAGVTYKLHLSDHELSGGFINEALHIYGEMISNKIRRPLYALANKHQEAQKKIAENKSFYFSKFREFENATQQTTMIKDANPIPPASELGAVGMMPKTAKPNTENVVTIPITPTAKGETYGGRIGVSDTQNTNGQRPTAKAKKKPTANGQTPTAAHVCSRKGCQQPYIKTVWNKRFCSEECKVKDWETRNRRKVYKKVKK